MIKRHQNAFFKKVADHFQCFWIELDRRNVVSANQMNKRDSCLLKVKYVVLLMLWNESKIKVRYEVIRFV